MPQISFMEYELFENIENLCFCYGESHKVLFYNKFIFASDGRQETEVYCLKFLKVENGN